MSCISLRGSERRCNSCTQVREVLSRLLENDVEMQHMNLSARYDLLVLTVFICGTVTMGLPNC